jgi:hypothetical protein
MRQVMKTIFLTAAVLLGLSGSALAYSLGGPIGNGGDSWQVQALSYNEPGDLNAPKNLGEEYRRNTPVMYYTYDQNFADYFGSSGIAAVDKAFTILNITFTNSPLGPNRGLDGYTANLSEFPLDTRHINYQAQALGIMDMKSITLGLMTEQLGLTDPVRYAWTLHDRFLPPGATCPSGEEYLVVQRNFDYISSPLNQLQYSPYVNDTLYSYQVLEACTGTPWLAVAAPFSVDPLADIYSPVASYFSGAIFWGDYYSGLTRDDVAGLRYLMQTNNVNFESVSPDTLLYTISTNTASGSQVVFPPILAGATNFVGGINGSGYYIFSGIGNNGYGYGDLAAFLAYAKTNGPAALLAAYPGVVINSVTNTFTVVSNATIVSYFTNAPVGTPFGTPPVLVIRTNYTPVFEFIYSYTFANVFTNHFGPISGQLVSITVGTSPGAPFGSPGVTNTIVKKLTTMGGDFFVLPLFYTNVCPLDILPGPSIAGVIAITNGFGFALTNSTTTNLTSEIFEVTYFTNYSYVVDPVTCSTIAGAAGKYQGIEKIQFVKVPLENYDTILGQFITPITNNYTLTLVTNGQLQVQHLQRIVTRPDILMTAADLAAGPGGVPAVPFDARNVNFVTANVLPQLAGPGTIIPQTQITWDKVGPVFFNTPSSAMDGTPFFTETPGGDLADLYYLEYFVLGSFDGTTNDPTVFPNGTSIDNLENQVLVHVSPTSVSNGQVGHGYPSVQFTASGGSVTPPFTWTATGLPDGLSVSPSGVLSGAPTEAGTFYFTLTLTDSTGLAVQWFYTLMIQ